MEISPEVVKELVRGRLPGKTRFFVYASNGSLPGKHLADLGKGSWDQLGKNTHGMF